MCCGGKSRPCWPSGGASPVPTISCGSAAGSPTSYVYDPFDRDMGWWNLLSGTCQIAGGQLRTTSSNVLPGMLITSRNPAGAEVVTFEGTFTQLVNNGITRGCGLFIGGYYLYWGYITALGNVGFAVSTSGNTPPSSTVYAASAGQTTGVIYNATLRIEVGSSETRFYVNGGLVYTLASTLDVFANKPAVRLSFNGASTQYAYCDSVTLYGFNLPVVCA